MSDLLLARRLLYKARRLREQARELHEEADELTKTALEHMTRNSPVRRTRPHRVYITEEMEREVFRLAKDRRLTQHEIANIVGLQSSGRVSEILNGRR